MKSSMKLTPIALAMAVALSSPLAMARGGNDHHNGGGNGGGGNNGNTNTTSMSDSKSNQRSDSSSSESEYNNNTSISVERTSSSDRNVDVKGDVYVRGYVRVDGTASATTSQNQNNYLNSNITDPGEGDPMVDTLVDNNARADGNGLQDASGNIGLNISAGDNNAQDNSVALSKVDAEFVFASADSISNQNAERNTYVNLGNRNNAHLSGNTLRDATGNVHVNIAAGQSNLQSNSLAASVNTSGSLAEATVSSSQVQDHNVTTNQGMMQEVSSTVDVALQGDVTGTYEGTSDQIGDVYLDTWTGSSHPAGNQTGHIDVDSEAQGAQDLNGDGGAFAFNEEGDITLGGTFTGQVVTTQWIVRPHENNASLGGDALRGASGNIGVNIASGSNNLQGNHLAIAAAMGAAPTNGGGE